MENRDLTAELKELRDHEGHTHFSDIGNAKKKRSENCGFTGVFEGFGDGNGKRPVFMD
jgi:hypothetical protein